MSKYLFLIGLVLVIWWLWRKPRKPAAGAPPTVREAETMVQCARCGVNQPIAESILAHGRYYCCVAHLREAGPDDS